jgi:hypothetical protein
MSTPTRILVFVAGLGAVFGLALGLGRLTDPDTEPIAEHDTHGAAAGEEPREGDEMQDATPLRLVPSSREFAPGDVPVSFQIQDDAGDPLTSYDVKHEKELHLIVLGTRSLTDFQHVHPTRAADGTWTAPLKLAPGTSYRLYADGSSGGADFLATADVFTTGHNPGPEPLPRPARTTQVDGLTVTLDQAAGTARLAVSHKGQPVELEPYLGALGHLVVIRADDLAYLHVHPEEETAPVFAVSGLAPGRYRYFFDFQVDGVVRTAAFTVDIGAEGQGEQHGEEGENEHSH